MAEEQQAQQPVFAIEKIYVRDLSLEVPNAPQIFLERDTPKIDVQLSTRALGIDAEHFEVVVTSTITAKLQEKTVFLVEVHQAGIFLIRNVPKESIELVQAVTCPNILFAYLRETVSAAVARAGFPPFYLAPVNFEALYQQRMQQAQATPAVAPTTH